MDGHVEPGRKKIECAWDWDWEGASNLSALKEGLLIRSKAGGRSLRVPDQGRR